jgi:hypothetical protein
MAEGAVGCPHSAGSETRRVSDLDDDFAAALQFPWYFGENWAAFDECIKDLAWLPAEAGYVVVLTDPLLVLEDSPEDFAVLVRVLGSAVEEWATPVDVGEWWDRPSVPFNVVLAAEEDEVTAGDLRATVGLEAHMSAASGAH